MWESLLFVSAAGILMLSLVPALRELFCGLDTKPLSIIQSYDNKVASFAARFSDFVSKESLAIAKGEPSSDLPSSYLFVNQSEEVMFTREESEYRLIRRVIIADSYLALPNDYAFTREIYSKHAIVGGHGARFKAVLSLDALELGEGCTIFRWAHARRVKLSSCCELRGRLSADEEIILHPSCSFERIHAPIIRFLSSEYESSSVRLVESEGLSLKSPILLIDADIDEVGRWLVKHDLVIPANSYLLADIVVQGDLTIGNGAVVEGSIKAYGNIDVEAGVKVTGALVCEKNILIGGRSHIQGPLSAEGCVAISSWSVIGSEKSPTTVTASKIKAEFDVVAHGTLWARNNTLSKSCYQ